MSTYNFPCSSYFLNSQRKYNFLSKILLFLPYYQSIVYNSNSIDITFSQNVDTTIITTYLSSLDIQLLDPNDPDATVIQVRDKLNLLIKLIQFI